MTGYLVQSRKEEDGDWHLLVVPDDKFKGLINERNIEKQRGALVVEVICSHKITQVDAIEACGSFSPEQVGFLHLGMHLRVTGSFVFDRQHGWTEIHPASKIEPLSTADDADDAN